MRTPPSSSTKPIIEFVSEDTLIIRFGDSIGAQLSAGIRALISELRKTCGNRIVDFIPSYTTLFIQFDLLAISPKALQRDIESAIDSLSQNPHENRRSKVVQIPVCYDPEFALDLEDMEKSCGLEFEKIVELHSGTAYTVYAIGFCPGFAFLGNVNEQIAQQRKATPRALVPAGSVGIANTQTAVYPMDSPGGWNIIGRSPMQLVDFSLPALCPFEIGDSVQFSPINRQEYDYLIGARQ